MDFKKITKIFLLLLKKLTGLMGFLILLEVQAQTKPYIKMRMLDYMTTSMEYVFEIKTTQFEKVTLDCQSFITGMNFFEAGQIKYNVYIDTFECEEMHNFLQDSKRKKLPVCIELDTEKNILKVSREMGGCA